MASKDKKAHKKSDDSFKPLPDHILLMLQEAEDLKFSGKYKAAIQIAEKILFEDPGNVPALEEIAHNYLSLNKIKQAE